ncbi:MAG: hypothetical protein A3I32_02375 [Candidatus Yanofskybacteria bacterium RIFCSPLOWO2_02_FULL_45_10]|uniref:Uncharacterized protein n=2 Tax=Candidatus Yanofskyibacteriota TaxID=1752733 RepID=A0A1F8G1B0_9BACT|nr:MAG: hypothetical protein A3F25_02915 [Candidatus Yanofskybacteria bacterium RIFCSPHIGHO2_12_FULL_45_19b]OGN32828.1 MAG: hypothetical protein A3I32_02375 [Candidatus Yanofskybacteria bacterium RIFCSPLOWO2_02_FULL_45_10]HXK35426.1 DUF5674 family protein [Candidatus Paceibacterota bacterium]
MQILSEKIKLSDLKLLAEKMFGNLVKGVVDIEQELVIIDGELHSDLAEKLVENGAKGINLWGFNIYPELENADWLEFDSMINVKPLLNNRTRNIEDVNIKEKTKTIIEKFVIR